MIEIIGCILLIIIGISFMCMIVDELRTNYKIISNKLYNEYTKTTIDYHTDYSKITKEQLYDTFKFHCQGQRILNEVVEYIYKLIQQDKETIGDDK